MPCDRFSILQHTVIKVWKRIDKKVGKLWDWIIFSQGNLIKANPLDVLQVSVVIMKGYVVDFL